MKKVLLAAIAIYSGILVGHEINWQVLAIGMNVIPLPQGVDFTSLESLKSSIHLLEFRHYVTPFLAHSLGSVAGALVGSTLITSNQLKIGLATGFIFLFEGIIDVVAIPAPTLFDVIDLSMAYLPMAWAGSKIGINLSA